MTILADQQTGEIITGNDWYQLLVDDCKAIITEAVFTSRWALVEGYHQLGERIVNENNLSRKEIYRKKIVQGLAQSIGISARTLHYAIQFYGTYPDINKLPYGKNISWNKIITELLPAPPKETPPLPLGKWRVVYADPPWFYTNSQHTDNANEMGEAQTTTLETHYESMKINELCALKIKDIVQENAVLFLWVTSPVLDQVWPVIEAWGFDYKTSIVWNKDAHNVGSYVSVRHEFLLICTRGSCTPDINKLFPSVITEKRKEHSVKPETFRKIIDAMYPEGNRIELFARREAEGWDRWGNESGI